jgi:hypothetical protein
MRKYTDKPMPHFIFNSVIYYIVLSGAPRSIYFSSFSKALYRHLYFLAPRRKSIRYLTSDRASLSTEIVRYLRIPLFFS